MNAVTRYFATFRSAPDDAPFVTLLSGADREAVSWGAFRRMCYAAANMMTDRGIGRGDVVLIFHPHQRWLLPSFFGAQLIGAIPSFMPPMNARQDAALFRGSHARLIAELNPALILVDERTAAALGDVDAPTLMLDAFDDVSLADVRAVFDAVDGPALLQHSSGTTGLKKGVVLGYDAIMAQIDGYGAALNLDGGETIVSWLPVYHDMGLIAATVLPFVTGTPLTVMGAFDWLAQPWRLLTEMAAVPHALSWLPNFAFASMTRTISRVPPDLRLDGIRGFINCSEPCKPETVDRFVDALASRGVRPEHVQACYAMAETVFAVSQSRLGEAPRRWTPTAQPDAGGGTQPQRPLISCGPPIATVQVEIRDAAGAALGEDAVGEIHVAGPSLFDGYRGQPALTARRLRDGWYATGDLGALHAGELYVAGRFDDLIIVAGRSLYAHEIEEEVSRVDGIKPGRVCAFGVANADTGTEDLVVLAELLSPDDTGVERAVRERLAGTVLVSSAHIVPLPLDTLIKTTSGKISRSENRARFERGELTSWQDSR
ncbi:AMP-binding protein [Sphingomonas arantia]|uniref:AMP-binding protein n=1 Tax=Sphingomonas arantia TaxID=1460676 RepID=A0ABW4TYB8_9SPHN